MSFRLQLHDELDEGSTPNHLTVLARMPNTQNINRCPLDLVAHLVLSDEYMPHLTRLKLFKRLADARSLQKALRRYDERANGTDSGRNTRLREEKVKPL